MKRKIEKSTFQNSESGSEQFDPIEVMNALPGTQEGYNCPKCHNLGGYYYRDGIYEIFKECECAKVRRCMKLIDRSGLKNNLRRCTFDNFETEKDFQKSIKSRAMEYTKNYKGKWFFIGGQVGCGKTHICTAIVGEFLNNSIPALYLSWRDEINKIKSNINNSEEYDRIISRWKKIDVLYIDDLFKKEQGKLPTSADIDAAYEILNYRYNNELITIISSERSTTEIIGIEQSIGSRIFQMSQGFCFNIAPDKTKNYRLKSIL